MLKVMTAHVYPPIPVRQFDWVAWFDNYGEEGPTAHGKTEDEAKASLLASQGMTPDGKCIRCGASPETVHGCAVGGCPIGEDS